MLTWRGKAAAAKGFHKLLKVPDGMNFTHEELDLAGWVHEYANQEKIPFKAAMERLFEYLKRHPKALESYTKGNADFAECNPDSVNFSAPRGWIVDPDTMAKYRQLRVYQAGNPDLSFSEAVQALGWG